MPAAEAARILAIRFGCSQRQARRYADTAARSGRVAVPEPAAVFTVKLPVRPPSASMQRFRDALFPPWQPRRWRSSCRGAAGTIPQVNDRAVETEFVFGRHAATDLSEAYAILVPQRQAPHGVGQEGRPSDDQRGDLRLASSARQKKDQAIDSQTAALRFHASSWG